MSTLTVADFGLLLEEAKQAVGLFGITDEARDEFRRLARDFEETFFAEEGIDRAKAREVPRDTQLGPLAGTKLLELGRWLNVQQL